MVHTSDGAVLLAWERSCTFLLFLWGAEHSRDQITSQSPVERTIKASAGQGEIYIKLTYLRVSFFFTAGAFLSRHTIWPLEPCTWLTRRTDNTFQFCTLCLCFSPEVAPATHSLWCITTLPHQHLVSPRPRVSGTTLSIRLWCTGLLVVLNIGLISSISEYFTCISNFVKGTGCAEM